MKITKKHVFSFLINCAILVPLLLISLPVSPAAAQPGTGGGLLAQQEGMGELRQVYGGNNAQTDPRIIIARIITIALGFLGVIFLVITVYAGFLYMTSGGNQEKAKEAMKLLTNAVVGLLIVLVSLMITRFVLVMLNRAAKGQPTNFYPYPGY